MWWTGSPVYTNVYTLRTGTGLRQDDPVVYYPNEYVDLYLDVLNVTQKYRGLLLHAVDSNDTVIGEWEVTGSGQDNLYFNPPHCPQSLMHTQAELKPSRSHFRFKAPPAGVGNITFYALIKVGTANSGWFYYPNGQHPNLAGATPVGGMPGIGKDLELIEGPERSLPWFLAGPGQSCEESCRNRSMACDEEAVSNASETAWPRALSNAVGETVSCPLPMKPTCHSVAPAMSRDGNCWYNSANDPIKGASVCPYMNTNPRGKQTLCATKKDSARRFCKCRFGVAAAAPLTAGTVEWAMESSTVVERSVASAAPGATGGETPTRFSTYLAAVAGVVTAITALSILWVLHSIKVPIVVALLGSGGIGGGGEGGPGGVPVVTVVTGHNWIHTPARAVMEASTTFPFRERTQADIHAQLGPGQNMSIMWASGHDQPHYFVIMAGEDQWRARSKDYGKWLDQYLAEAPPGANRAAENPRIHMCYLDSWCLNNPLRFVSEVRPGDPEWCHHPRNENGIASRNRYFRWNPYYLRNDHHTFYSNPKFPWIIGVLKYGQDYDMAIDGDTVCVEVPAQPGKGQHYVVHYWWRGYYDAIDVHTHDFQVPEELKYGNRTNSFVYNKIDHCTYRNPRKILTPIFDATHSVKDCVDAVNAIVPAQESIGINVVLRDTMDASLPVLDRLRNVDNAPWHLDNYDSDIQFPDDYIPIALDNPLMQIPPNSTEFHGIDWPAFRNASTVQAGACELRDQNLNVTGVSLRTAVEMCLRYRDSKRDCFGISWLQDGQPDDAIYSGYNHTFIICEDMKRYGAKAFTFAPKPTQRPTLSPTTVNSATVHPTASPKTKSPTRTPTTSSPSTAAPTDQRWTTFLAPTQKTSPEDIAPEQWNSTNHFRIRISFQPHPGSGLNVGPTSTRNWMGPHPPIKNYSIPEEFYTDTGKVYGVRYTNATAGNVFVGNLSYGWKCALGNDFITRHSFYDGAHHPWTGIWYYWLSGHVWRKKASCMHRQTWEIEVPNGVYVVTTTAQRLVIEGRFYHTYHHTLAVEVEVRDGRLTLGSPGGVRKEHGGRTFVEIAGFLRWIQIDRLYKSTYPDNWLKPKGAVAWRQDLLDDPRTPVGIVTVALPGAVDYSRESARKYANHDPNSAREDCRQAWLFDEIPTCSSGFAVNGIKKGVMNTSEALELFKQVQPSKRYGFFDKHAGYFEGHFGRKVSPRYVRGYFERENQGFTVALSNHSCEEDDCPGEEYVCEKVNYVPYNEQTETFDKLSIFKIDCRGGMGKYLRLRLHGNNSMRVMPSWKFDVTAHRTKIKLTDNNVITDRNRHVKINETRPKRNLVCYGVDPVPSTPEKPSFSIVHDTESPIFYGTCFTRTRVIHWLPTQNVIEEVKKTRWAFNGKCLSCSSYYAGYVKPYNYTTFPSPQWHLDENCVDCAAPNRSARWFDDPPPTLNSTAVDDSQAAAINYDTIGSIGAGVLAGILAVAVGILAFRRYRLSRVGQKVAPAPPGGPTDKSIPGEQVLQRPSPEEKPSNSNPGSAKKAWQIEEQRRAAIASKCAKGAIKRSVHFAGDLEDTSREDGNGARGPELKESKFQFIDPSLEESSDDPLMDLIDDTEGLHVHHFDYLAAKRAAKSSTL